MEYVLTRDITKKECDWLVRDFKTGEIVYKYYGDTFGCCSRNGAAFTLEKDKEPFFELPLNGVKVV